MSDRPIDIKVGSNSTAKTITQAVQELEAKQSPEELAEQKKAYKARVARVLDRGFTVDRLTVPIPPEDGLWGEWIPNTPADLARADILGFKADKKYAVGRSLNDGGDGTNRVGDVIFMVQPSWMHEAIVEERAQRYAEAHLTKQQKEERDFAAVNKELDMPSIVTSKLESVSGPEITERLSPTPS